MNNFPKIVLWGFCVPVQINGTEMKTPPKGGVHYEWILVAEPNLDEAS